jgi:hypothetical protein
MEQLACNHKSIATFTTNQMDHIFFFEKFFYVWIDGMRWKGMRRDGINLYSIIWIIKITMEWNRMEWNRMELTPSHTTNLSSILFHSISEVREGM